jgi:hypothetical protein
LERGELTVIRKWRSVWRLGALNAAGGVITPEECVDPNVSPLCTRGSPGHEHHDQCRQPAQHQAIGIAAGAGQWLTCHTADGAKTYGIPS